MIRFACLLFTAPNFVADVDLSQDAGATPGVLAPDTGEAGTRPPRGGQPGAGGAIVGLCQRIAGDFRFQNFILAVIVANAVVIGLETSSTVRASVGGWTDSFNLVAQAIFTIEIAIRLTAYWPRPMRFFRNGWNTFDFAIVSIAFIPATGGLSNLARLARIARATRIISARPELRLVFETILRSIPSVAHILVLLGLFLYVYGIVGFNLFSATDPNHWGSLGASFLTLFQVMTLEGWNEVQAGVSHAHPWSWLYFISFIVVAVWVVTNLFVAVIINNFRDAKQAHAERFDLEVPGRPIATIAEIRQALIYLERDIRAAEKEIRDPNHDSS